MEGVHLGTPKENTCNSNVNGDGNVALLQQKNRDAVQITGN